MISPETMKIVDNGNRETTRSWVFVVTKDWQKERLNEREFKNKIRRNEPGEKDVPTEKSSY
jgi:hypothetical protein